MRRNAIAAVTPSDVVARHLCGRHTALEVAADNGDARVVEVLIAAGADVRGNAGCDRAPSAPVPSTAASGIEWRGSEAALLLAARGSHADIIATLVAAGADRCG